MEQHGKNPLQFVIAVVPARYSSVRLPGKLLLPLAGKPLILHTLDRVRQAATIDRVIVATDNERILEAVSEAGVEAVMTSPDHSSGSDRIAEVAARLPENSVVVNVQGDEPVISPQVIDLAVEAMLAAGDADIVTTSEPFRSGPEVIDPNNVKVVTDRNGFALYFSRAPIPFPRQAASEHRSLVEALQSQRDLIKLYRKHTGLYVYRRDFLLEFTKQPQSFLERTEMLEQLRALEAGARIKVVETSERSIGVDTADDLEAVREILA